MIAFTYNILINVHGLFFLEKPTIEIFCDQEDDMYYVSEDVTIKAELKNASNVLCLVWQTETLDGDQALNITHSKYNGTKITIDEARLCQMRDKDVSTHAHVMNIYVCR